MLPSVTNWPGEREPSCTDVEIANETPEAAWFSDFKSCLLSDPEAVGDDNLMQLELHVSNQAFLCTLAYLLLVNHTKKVHLSINVAVRVS